jgi:GNAT superfamily N-acetyltransferase
MEFVIEPLEKAHDRKAFDCGSDMLNAYLKNQSSQDVRRNLAVCFVMANQVKEVKAFYTLSTSSVRRDDLSELMQKKLPPAYFNIPVTLLGRLAVDSSLKGRGYGELLLLDALKRAYQVSQSSIGSHAIIVDPIDDSAVSFYHRYGFQLLPDSGKMLLPMKTVASLF